METRGILPSLDDSFVWEQYYLLLKTSPRRILVFLSLLPSSYLHLRGIQNNESFVLGNDGDHY
jgi:hypothetical protein